MSESFSLYYLEHQPEKLGNFKLFASCLADLFQRFSGRCLDLTQKEKTEIRNFSGTLATIELFDPSRKLLTSCENKLPTFNRFLAELLSVLAP